MKRHYDFVYLTNTPSFYKLNLCDEIAREASVLLVFYGYGAEAVNTELRGEGKFRFDYVFLNEEDSNKRNKLAVFFRLLRLMSVIHAKQILFSGWLAPEYNLFSFLSPRKRNVIVCESSVWDISLTGIKGALKKAVISRMADALPSGEPHKQFFTSIGFKGKTNITGSVGIFRKGTRRATIPNAPLRFIYVGRLIDVKNVSLLIDVFNRNGKLLTIVGKGNLEDRLKAMAQPNITFTGFINNEQLGEVYQRHDVFILPSKYEPWGLVVEEAIYWGLPVIVSDKVGSSIDIVQNLGTGRIFKSGDPDALAEAVNAIEKDYQHYKDAVDAVDWKERDRRQVNAYLDLLS